jgi:hypothetical protein
MECQSLGTYGLWAWAGLKTRQLAAARSQKQFTFAAQNPIYVSLDKIMILKNPKTGRTRARNRCIWARNCGGTRLLSGALFSSDESLTPNALPAGARSP